MSCSKFKQICLIDLTVFSEVIKLEFWMEKDQTIEAHHVSGYIFMYLDDKPVEKVSFSQNVRIKFVLLRSPLHQNNVGEKNGNCENEPNCHQNNCYPDCDLNDLQVDDNNERNDLTKENEILLSESLRDDVSLDSNYESFSLGLLEEVVESFKIDQNGSSKELVSSSDRAMSKTDLLAGLHCKLCQKWFPSLRKETEHSRNTLCQTKCIQCGIIFPSKGDLFRHQYEAYNLSFLQSQFPEFKLDTEIQRPNDKEKIVCPICGLVVIFRHFRQHVYFHFLELSYKCCLCGEAMKTAAQLSAHRRTHTSKQLTIAQNIEASKQQNDTRKICTSAKVIGENKKPKKVLKRTLVSRKEGNMATKLKKKNFNSINQKLISSNGLNEENLTTDEDYQIRANEASDIANINKEEKNSLQCPYCKKSFSSRALFRSHKETPSLNLKCQSCDVILPSQAWMIIHEFEVHQNFKPLAETFVSSANEVEENDRCKDKLHGNSQRPKLKQFVSCPICSVPVTREVLPEHIMRRHTQEKPYQCCICGFPCHGSKRYRDHCDEHIGKSKKGLFRCSSCPEIFTTKSDFCRHVVVHKSVCHFCNIDFKVSNLLNAHYNTEHYDQLIKCKQCDKRLPSERKLKQHERHHRFNYRRPCPKCGAMVIRVDQHMERRHAEPSYEFLCTLCPKKFKQQHCLQSHLRQHAALNRGEKFACPKCPKTFSTRMHLAGHVRVHLTYKMHKCPICGKLCRQKFNLKIHMRIHYDQKLFHCDICNQGFNYKVSLVNHQKSKH
ncbi:hypothetical protein Btru_003230 [Bulinus truncatus]|nr:hypothetical protein Btru_003230 [Bulinus truncatus]